MKQENNSHNKNSKISKPFTGLGYRIRNYFLTGLVIAAPIIITVYLTKWFINLTDQWIKPLIPSYYLPDNYLPFAIPGFGLLVSFLALTLLGLVTANLVGKSIISAGESILDRMPFIRNIYRALKQIFETVLSEKSDSFRSAALIEYPRKGLWALVFISTKTKGEILEKIANDSENKDFISVFLPTTPNPTSGFCLFVPINSLVPIDMKVEDAAKVVISAGLIYPGDNNNEGA